jgi:NtrC-family two-component system response regulator AlgB
VRALIVDDEKNIRRAFLMALESMGHESTAAESGALAIEELKASSYDVAFLDLKLSEESGLDVLQEILSTSPRTAVIIVTAYASVETAVEAMRRGAFDYLPKPMYPGSDPPCPLPY